jgi:CheY-like chemotaxis protein
MILIVDDERNNLIIVGKYLDRYGFKHMKASNGAEALELIKSNDFTLMLLDIQMPVMDGLTCAKKVRSLNGNKSDLPMVALTSQIIRSELDGYKNAGINDYLIKPFNADELKVMIEKHQINKCQDSGIEIRENTVQISEHEVIQLDYINRLAFGDKKFIKEMLVAVSEDLPYYIAKITEYWLQKDEVNLKRIVHKANSPFSSIGLNSLSCIDFFLNESSPKLFDANGKQQFYNFQDISKKAMKELHQELNFH